MQPISDTLPIQPVSVQALALTVDVAIADRYIVNELSPRCKAEYRSHLTRFAKHCEKGGSHPLDADDQTFQSYFTELATSYSAQSILNHMNAISWYYRTNSRPNPRYRPAVKEILKAIRRTRPYNPKQPLTLDGLRAMLSTIGAGPLGLRDRSIITLGFASAATNHELRTIQLFDIEDRGNGVLLTLRKASGEKRNVFIGRGSDPATDPIQSLQAWLTVRGQHSGPLFVGFPAHGVTPTQPLSRNYFSTLIDRLTKNAGLPSRAFSTISLRKGFMLAAATAGVSTVQIMHQTGLKTIGELLKNTNSLGQPFELQVEVARKRRRAKWST